MRKHNHCADALYADVKFEAAQLGLIYDAESIRKPKHFQHDPNMLRGKTQYAD